jgi:hypothetical protein
MSGTATRTISQPTRKRLDCAGTRGVPGFVLHMDCTVTGAPPPRGTPRRQRFSVLVSWQSTVHKDLEHDR